MQKSVRLVNKHAIFILAATKEKEHDFAIAVSVGPQNLAAFKGISKELVNRNPTSKTGYSIMVYNSGVTTLITFKDKLSSDDQMKSLIDRVPPRVGFVSRLDRALEEAKNLFANGSGSRPHAKKVLIIYTDTTPTVDEDAVVKNSKSLEADGIHIIVVVLNMRSVPEACGVIAPNIKSVVPARRDKDPKDVTDMIDEALKTGVFGRVLLDDGWGLGAGGWEVVVPLESFTAPAHFVYFCKILNNFPLTLLLTALSSPKSLIPPPLFFPEFRSSFTLRRPSGWKYVISDMKLKLGNALVKL